MYNHVEIHINTIPSFSGSRDKSVFISAGYAPPRLLWMCVTVSTRCGGGRSKLGPLCSSTIWQPAINRHWRCSLWGMDASTYLSIWLSIYIYPPISLAADLVICRLVYLFFSLSNVPVSFWWFVPEVMCNSLLGHVDIWVLGPTNFFFLSQQ